MRIPTWENWFAIKPSAGSKSQSEKTRSELRVGIPRVLNIWSTHQFWVGFFNSLGIERVVFSSATSEEQGRTFAGGRGTVDCCYPVKAMSGHYGELVFGQKRKIDILFSPLIRNLPSPLLGHVVDTLSCPRVMAAPENIKAGFLKTADEFAAQGVTYVAPLVCLGEPRLMPRQMYQAFAGVIPGLTPAEAEKAVTAGYAALENFDRMARKQSRDILTRCAEQNTPCILVLARPYHMDPGIGHEIETDLQAHGYPILWAQYLPTDEDLMTWLFGDQLASGEISSPFDIRDVWLSSYSGNTNEILWGAKVGARLPWVTCVIRLVSYECGMDQPTFTPVQQIVESAGTLFFSFQDLDSTKPAGSVKIRIETIAHYLASHSPRIMQEKLARTAVPCPLTAR